MPSTKKLLQAAAGAGGTLGYVEDVFSTYLYTGNDSTQSINNGVDLDGEGGLVWLKFRDLSISHKLTDTVRGTNSQIESDDTAAELTAPNVITAFNSNGFTLGNNGTSNGAPYDFVSWTFRKAEKFFDVVTYTGNGTISTDTQTISHNLGSTPGCIIIKDLDSVSNWGVYHRGANGGTDPEDYYLLLNLTNAEANSTTAYWGGVAPTDTEFSVRGTGNVNISGNNYVAYLFAHDAGGFGDNGSESIIKCGSYTGNGSSTGPSVSLGWEPQWLLIKNASLGTENWVIFDAMRGMTAGAGDVYLRPNASDAESAATTALSPTPDGFELTGASGEWNGNGNEMIYIAIRRPMKTPESGTEVFEATSPAFGTGSNATINANFTVDLIINLGLSSGVGNSAFDRLRGRYQQLLTEETTQEVSRTDTVTGFDVQNGFTVGSGASGYVNYASYNYNNLLFKRATGFFDVVAYTGTGVARTVNHNLGVAPELMIIKSRSAASNWRTYNATNGNTKYMNLQDTDAAVTDSTNWNNTSPTASVFTVGTNSNVNASAGNFVAYLFATLAGVSKVGSYTGTAADLNVDCGFSAGARFILIKRTDSTGDWYVYDSARGITSGNDPYLLLNSSAAEVTSTDYIDPLNAGFTVTSSAPAGLNASGGTYIFLAIA